VTYSLLPRRKTQLKATGLGGRKLIGGTFPRRRGGEKKEEEGSSLLRKAEKKEKRKT